MPNKAFLETLDEEFSSVELPPANGPVPDGEYVVRVDGVEVRESQEGNVYLNWDLIIQGGDYSNRHLFRNNMLMTAQNLGFLKRDLKFCGIDIDAEDFKISEFLTEGLNQLLDLKLIVSAVKQKDNPNRQNVYINSLLLANAPKTAGKPAKKTAAKSAPKAQTQTDDAFDPFAEE